MLQLKHLSILFFLCAATGFSQRSTIAKIEIKGSVKAKESGVPISDVQVSTTSGTYARTDFLGAFKIMAEVGDELLVESPEFDTVRYVIKDGQEITILVAGGSETERRSSFKSGGSKAREQLHQNYLDSAKLYKKDNIKKSIDFITRSIAELGKRADKKLLARSLTTLGEVYRYHGQLDLAITNFEDALEANKTIKTALLLASAYIQNGDYDSANASLQPLRDIKNMVPYQQIALYESLGDAQKGLGETGKSVAFYEEGLKVARQNRISPKMADLNSKIADAYAKGDQEVEAEGFYQNSLELAAKQAPKRAIQEKEKVADFYNLRSRYPEEIRMRKKSLEELRQLPRPKVATQSAVRETDTITAQRINYKIANAYIAQDKYDEAIPYLKRSIVEADGDNDLIVQKDATRKLSEVYEYRGDYTKAFETYRNYTALVDTLYIRKEQELSRAARFNREVASKQSRIAGLEQERELSQSKYALAVTEQQLVEESFKRQKWIIYSLLFGIVFLGLAAFFFYRSNQQQKLANNLLALKSLRSQMNPHFIFNALNSVNNYIAKSDERSANRYLSEFSTLMRAVLENSEEDFIPLSKELELLQLYVKLEHSRFPEKFDYDIAIDDHLDVAAFQIPPMLLQPYIENAIWHGLRYKEEKGFLDIALRQKTKDTIEITISDDGIGRRRSAALKTQHQKKQKSKGMGNIKKRIAILNDMYKDRVEVAISDLNADGSGTKVVFMLNRN